MKSTLVSSLARNWRYWIFWLLLSFFIWFVIRNLKEIELLARTMAQGKWQWLALAASLQVVYYIVYTGLYTSAFLTVGVESRIFSLIPVVLSSLFINVAVPTGGTAGPALFVDDVSRRGQSPARAAAGVFLAQVVDFSSFAIVLVIGLSYLFLYHDLQVYEIVSAGILALLILGLVMVLILGFWKPLYLKGLLRFLQRWIEKITSWFHRSSFLSEDWSERTAEEFISAGQAIRLHPAQLIRTLGIGLAANLFDLASIYVLFLAFNHPVSLGVLVAGFAIGVLFWIVSITPQGIGVVEGVMALTYASLGVPVAIATAVTLAFRGLTFWLPLGLGFILLSRTKTFHLKFLSPTGSWGVHTIALLTALMGLVNLLSAITPSLSSRMQLIEKYFPLEVRRGSHLTAALAGFALLLLAGSLWRRKRLAWFLTLVVLSISIASHLLKGLDYEEAILAGLLALWLVLLRPHFHARSDPPSVRQGLWTLAAALGFTLIYGTFGFYLLDHHFKVNFGLGAAIKQTLIMFTQFYDPGLEPITGFGRYFSNSIYLVGAGTIGYALLMFLRPMLVRLPSTPREKMLAQQIVEKYGRSSLTRLTLLDDKSYYFSPGGSVVAYVVKGRIALTLGDPIGPAEDLRSAIENFRSFCSHNDWEAAFCQILPDTLETYLSLGFHSFKIGMEAIVNLENFTLEGRSNKGLRSAFNRLTKLGYTAKVIHPPFSDDLMDQLRSVSDDWLTSMHGSEKRFSLGWFEDSYIQSGPVIVIQTSDEIITAFANITTEYQLNEITIDLMRHRRSVEPGTMDFLFIGLFQWAKEQGYDTFNLGLSPLSGIGEEPEDPAIEKALHFVYEHINQFYSYKGLHHFKEKFQPDWSPRYLIYLNTANLPMVGIALTWADSGSLSIRDILKEIHR